METIPKEYRKIDDVMSNFDKVIREEVASRLKVEEVYAAYTAYHFCGYVWWDRKEELYKCEIWTYKEHVDTLKGTLEEIMEEACDTYGAS